LICQQGTAIKMKREEAMKTQKRLQVLAIAILYAAGCGLVGSPNSVFAATTNVSVVSFTYNPVAVAIHVNDTVEWTWAGPFHSTTSDTAGLWDSGVHSAPFTFTNKFTTAGTFPYYCTIHVTTFNMRGSVIVQPATAQPPTLTVPERTPPSDFQFSYSTEAGLSYVIQRSGDLTNWVSLSTNTAATDITTFLDSGASNSANFYRVQLLSNP
jgi:plastocyanin